MGFQKFDTKSLDEIHNFLASSYQRYWSHYGIYGTNYFLYQKSKAGEQMWSINNNLYTRNGTRSQAMVKFKSLQTLSGPSP